MPGCSWKRTKLSVYLEFYQCRRKFLWGWVSNGGQRMLEYLSNTGFYDQAFDEY